MDPISVSGGIVGNIATNILLHFAPALDSTLAGRALRCLGLLPPNIVGLLRNTLTNAITRLIQTHPEYDISGVELFFTSPVVVHQIGSYVLEGKMVDKSKVEQLFNQYLADEHLTRTIIEMRSQEPQQIVADFLTSYTTVLMEHRNDPQMMLLLAITEQTTAIETVLQNTIQGSEDRIVNAIKALLEHYVIPVQPLPRTDTALQNWLDGAQFDLAAIINDRTQGFIGRDWVFSKISTWLKNDSPTLALLTGVAGAGKTAIAARLQQLSDVNSGSSAPYTANRLQSDVPSAIHFCSASDARSIDPRLVAGSLARQLANHYPAFHSALTRMAPDPRMLSSTSDVWAEVLLSPLAELTSTSILIVIDSLDEAQQHTGETLVDILTQIGTLPHVRWLFTSRDVPEIIERFPTAWRLDLTRDAPPDVHDVHDYVADRLASLSMQTRLLPAVQDTLAKRISAPEQGNFLYARYVLDELLPQLEFALIPEQIKLPSGLSGVYRNFLDRIAHSPRNTTWRQYLRPILGLMTVAQEPLTYSQLIAWSGINATGVQDTINDLASLLTFLQGERVTFFHQSFADFLLNSDAGGYKLNPMDYHRIIAAHFPDLGKSVLHHHNLDEYLMRHTPTHLSTLALDDQAAVTDLVTLLTDLTYLETRLYFDRNTTWLLEQDFSRALNAPLRADEHSLLYSVGNALRFESHILSVRPQDFFVQLYNRLWRNDGGPIDHILELSRTTARSTGPWLRAIHPLPTADPALRRILPGHSSSESTAGVTATGERHAGAVRAVAIHATTSRAISGGDDGTVRVWDALTGEPELNGVLRGHSGAVLAVGLSADGATAISGGTDGTIRFWQVDKPKSAMFDVSAHVGSVWAISMSPDGQLVASSGADNTLCLWSVGKSLSARMLTHLPQAVLTLAFCTNDHVIAGDESGTLCMWNVVTGRVVSKWLGHEGAVRAISVSAFGQIVSGGDDGKVKVWNLEDQELTAEWIAHEHGVLAVSINGFGQIVSGGDDGKVKVWNWKTGDLVSSLKGHARSIYALSLRDDGWLVSGGDDGTVRVWDLAFMQRSTMWAIETDSEATLTVGHSGVVNSVAISANGEIAATGGADGTVRIWNVLTSQQEKVLHGHTDWIWAVALSDDGQRAVSGGVDTQLRVWDIGSGQEGWALKWTLKGHSGTIWGVGINSSGEWAGSGAEDGTVRIWNLFSGKEAKLLPGHDGAIMGVGICNRGEVAVSAGEDRKVRIWNVETGSAQELHGHTEWVRSLGISTDGRFVISAGDDCTVRAWEISTGKEVATLDDYDKPVWVVRVTGDGKLAVAGGDDGTLRVWDLITHAELARYTWDVPVYACAISPDGRVIIAGDARGAILFFVLEWEA